MKTKNSLLRILIIMLIGGLGGGFSSIFFMLIATHVNMPSLPYNFSMLSVFLIIWSVLTVFFGILSFFLYFRLIRFKQNSLEEELYYQLQDRKTNFLLMILAIQTIIQFFFLISLALEVTKFENPFDHSLKSLLIMGCIIIVTIISTLLEVKTINFVKKVNPEKKGDPLTVSFQQDWIQSCDEAERLTIYHACYKTFQFMKYVFIGLFLALLYTSFFIPITILSVGIICFCWLMHTVSYYYFVSCISKKRLNI